jgi:drug/metabolite transporter (DMT)-like permease
VVVKLILLSGLTPIAVATFRFLCASALFLVALVLIRWKNPNYQLRINVKDIGRLLFLALTGVTFFFTIQYTGVHLAGASIAAIFVCLLSPIVITVLSTRIFKDHLTRKQVLGVTVAAAGTFLTIIGGTYEFSFNETFFRGSLLLLCTPFLWAAYTLAGKKMMEKYDAFLVVSYVSLLGGLLLLPFSLFENSLWFISLLTLQEWLALLYLSVACSMVGYFIWFYLLKQLNASVVSSFLFAEPLVTVIFACVFVGEVLTPPILVGAFLICGGVYLVAKRSDS